MIAMGYLAHRDIFECILQLMCFRVYFKTILNNNWLNNDIIAARMLGVQRHKLTRGNSAKMVQFNAF